MRYLSSRVPMVVVGLSIAAGCVAGARLYGFHADGYTDAGTHAVTFTR